MKRPNRRRGRPKLHLKLKAGDRVLLKRIAAGKDSNPQETVIARSLLLAATGEYTHQEIANACNADGISIEPEDIVHLDRILRRLQQHRVPAVFAIWRRLRPATQVAIIKGRRDAPALEQLRKALALELTALVRSGKVFEKAHLAFIGNAEAYEQELSRELQGVRLWSFNRRFLNSVLDGEIRDRLPATVTKSRIQSWISRYRQGLDEVLIKRHSRPRGELASLELMVWLIAGSESGNVKEPKEIMPWLRRRCHSCLLKRSTAERYLRDWRRLRSLSMAQRMKTFLMISGFIHRFATTRHKGAIAAMEQLRRSMSDAEPFRGTSE